MKMQTLGTWRDQQPLIEEKRTEKSGIIGPTEHPCGKNVIKAPKDCLLMSS